MKNVCCGEAGVGEGWRSNKRNFVLVASLSPSSLKGALDLYLHIQLTIHGLQFGRHFWSLDLWRIQRDLPLTDEEQKIK